MKKGNVILTSLWYSFLILENKNQIYLYTLNKFLCANFIYCVKRYFNNFINKINITKINKYYKGNDIVSLYTIL